MSFEHIRAALLHFTEIRAEKDDNLSDDAIATINQIIDAAADNVITETDYEINALQLEQMRDVYAGNVIEVEGRLVGTNVVELIDYMQQHVSDESGEDILAWKVETIAPGVSLNSPEFYSLDRRY